MAWYDDSSVPSNPIAIWDSSKMVGGVMQDRIGSNHLDMRGGASSSVSHVSGVKGTRNMLTLPTPIALSGAKTAFYIGIDRADWDPANEALIAFHNGVSNTNDLLGYTYQSPAGAAMQARKGGVSTSVPDTRATFRGEMWFVAIVMDGTNARHYINGDWLGGSFSQSNYIMSHIRGMASWNIDGSPYCLSEGDLMCAAGVYNSAATLAQLQALEALARDEYKVGMFVYQSGIWKPVMGVNVATL